MNPFPALLDPLLTGIRESLLSRPYSQLTTLEPVWVVPMIRRVELPPTHADALRAFTADRHRSAFPSD